MKKLFQVGDYRSLSETCLRSESWIYVVLRHKKCRGIEPVYTQKNLHARIHVQSIVRNRKTGHISTRTEKYAHFSTRSQCMARSASKVQYEFIHSFRIVHSQLMDSPFNLDMVLDRGLFQWLRNSPNKKCVFCVGLVTWNSRPEIS